MNPPKAVGIRRPPYGSRMLAHSLTAHRIRHARSSLDPPSIPTRCDMTLPPQRERGVSCRNFTCVIQRTMILNEPLQRARQEKRRVMNDASLQIGQPIRANPSPSSVSCIEMHGSLSKLRNGPHFRPDYLPSRNIRGPPYLPTEYSPTTSSSRGQSGKDDHCRHGPDFRTAFARNI